METAQRFGRSPDHHVSDWIPDFAIQSLADNELMYSFDFELPGEPAQIAPLRTMRPQSNGNYFFDPNSFTENASDSSQPPCSEGAVFGCYEPTLFGSLGNAPRTILLRAAYQPNRSRLAEDEFSYRSKRIDFRAEFFNMFNHTQFYTPDGNTSDGSQIRSGYRRLATHGWYNLL